jgi:hypothetical protein
MALSGSLKDFDLSYIFQIVAHEGKTGRLTLSGPDGEGSVVFRNGKVVCASVGDKSIPAMLSRYLSEIRGCPSAEIDGMHRHYGSSLRRLGDEYRAKGYLTDDELMQIVETGIEDLACSLFLWDEGTYSFEVLQQADAFQAGAIAVAYENITMEAVRRADEYRRIRDVIDPSTVYIRSDIPYESGPGDVSPFDDLTEYIYARIDGTSPVDYLCRCPFVSDYRVYEALNILLDEGRITPLSAKLSRSINAALRREKGDGRIESMGSDAVLSIVATAAAILAILFVSIILLRGHFMADQLTRARTRRQATPLAWSAVNTEVATLWYRARHGSPPSSLRALVDDGLVTRRDTELDALDERQSH